MLQNTSRKDSAKYIRKTFRNIVGAIANEANMRGSEIGAIKINDKSAFVQVPESSANKVLRSLDGTKIRNKPVKVRRANN